LRWRYRQLQFDPPFAQAVEEGRKTLGKLGDKWDNVLSFVVARNTGAYYTVTGHSLAPVPLLAIGVGAERFGGHLDNTDIGQTMFRLAGRQDFGTRVTTATAAAPAESYSSIPSISSMTDEAEEGSPGASSKGYGQRSSSPSGKSATTGSRKGRATVRSKRSVDEDE
jgi:hypothetical protein